MSEEMTTSPENIGESQRLFTREQLEKIVEQRILRERKNFEHLEKVRGVLSQLRKKELFKNTSNASIAQTLEELVSEREDAKNTALLQADAAATPDNAADAVTEQANANVAENESTMQVPTQKVQDGRKKELSDFLAAYGEEKLTDILSDPAFRSFSRGRYGDILSIYEEYCGFLSQLSESPEAKRYRAAQRELASTGFSGGASCATDYGSLLSDNQKRIAKAAGMSYRQYSELLSQIPTKRL
ncbi:MAG: hypothetical protein E7656_03080 [Ruminococcaceae bacterium]|nr:hypothetical protein [Oscillospiraceae bacterium]